MRSKRHFSRMLVFILKGLPSVGRPFSCIKKMKNLIPFLGLVLFLFSCQGTKIDQLLRPASPYEKYLQDLNASTLKNSGMVKEWIRAS